MIGNLKIEITQETLNAAVQLYLGTQFAEGKVPKVLNVEITRGAGYAGDNRIVVTAERPTAEGGAL